MHVVKFFPRVTYPLSMLCCCFSGTGKANGCAVEPTISEQSSVVLVTPEMQSVKENREGSPPPTVRCPCGVHEVKKKLHFNAHLKLLFLQIFAKFHEPCIPQRISFHASLSLLSSDTWGDIGQSLSFTTNHSNIF